MANKKRNNRKKSTKQASATPPVTSTPKNTPLNTTTPEISTAPLPDFIQTSIDTAINSRVIDVESIIFNNKQQPSPTSDTTIPVPVNEKTTAKTVGVEDAPTTTNLPDFIQTAIDNAVGARVVDIENIINSVKQKVANGEYKEEPKETSSTTPKAAVAAAIGTTKDTDTTKLSDAVEYAIQSVVKSPVVDAYKISQSGSTTQESSSTEPATQESKAAAEKSVNPAEQNVGDQSKTSSEQKSTDSNAKPPAAPPKTGDNVQKKGKSSEHKKSNFLKKKDCIIL